MRGICTDFEQEDFGPEDFGTRECGREGVGMSTSEPMPQKQNHPKNAGQKPVGGGDLGNNQSATKQEFTARMRRWRISGVAALALVTAFLGYFAVYTSFGQTIDTLVMNSMEQHFPLTYRSGLLLADLVSTRVLLIVAVIILAAIIFRHRFALFLRVTIVLVGANALTQILKMLLTRPDLGVGYALSNSFPSGHVTLVAAVGLILIGVVPIRWRTLAGALAWITTSGTALTVMALGWHRLSDVLAALFISGGFALLALPSEWQPTRSLVGLRLVRNSAWAGVLLGLSGGLITIFLSRAALDSSLSAVQLTLLSSQAGPGLILALFGGLLTMSVAALMVVSVDELAGN